MTANSLLDKTQADYRNPEVRLSLLLDDGFFIPLHEADDSGACGVRGRIHGENVLVYCTDARVMGGAMSAAGCQHIVTVIDTAVAEGCPVIGVWHSGGARLADGVGALDGVGSVFAAMIRASGWIPQISVVLGPAAGGAAYGPALTDVVIMSPAARLFVTGPDVVHSVTGEQIDMEQLGGPEPHSRRSGVAHIVASSEAEAFSHTRHVTDLLGRPGVIDRRLVGSCPDLGALLPDQAQRAYDVRPLVGAILDPADEGSNFAELQPKWAPNVVIGLGRLAGRTVGVIANNPLRRAGCLDSLSAEKAARFVRMCDSFGIPMLVIVDVPGYLPGTGQEWDGVVRRGAKLLHAFGESVVPRVTLITRKSFGGAYIAMNSRALGATNVFAWPDAEVAVMGAEAAVKILHRKKLAAVPDGLRADLCARLVEEHRQTAGGVRRAVDLGSIDEVIQPRQTRQKVAAAFAAAPVRRGRHGNIPL
jgi:acetyl-CoA/propionyl-CoA carboxylase carboxyl transferase subunit